jgi:hypothetical protein
LPGFWSSGPRGGFGEGADDFGGLVAGAVVDDDDLGAPAALADAGDDRFKRARCARPR